MRRQELLTTLQADHSLVIIIKDGEVMDGYGQNVAAFYGDTDMKVRCHDISKAFHTEFKAEELLAEHVISVEKLTEEIVKAL